MPRLASRLEDALSAAQLADRRGNERVAGQALTRVRVLASGVRNAQARAALVDLARRLKAQL